MHVVGITRRTLVAAALSTAALVVLLCGCAPAPATDRAASVAALYGTFMLAAVGVFAIVAGLITWSIVRYRSRPHDALPAQTRTNVPLEIVWWTLPTLLVVGLFVISAQVLANVDRGAGDGALRIDVEGFQWQWRFTYPDDGIRVIGRTGQPPQIVVPVGRPIEFVITSPDVIHSFYVPSFLIKRDAVPGIVNHVSMTVDREGTFSGQCAEFCGLLHSDMLFSIRAVSPAAFDAWRQAQQRSTPASP